MRRILIATAILLCIAQPAPAYIGPGVGAGLIATVLGILAAIGLALFAVFWYPIKRLIKRNSKREKDR
jgi:flagellar motor component MotA